MRLTGTRGLLTQIDTHAPEVPGEAWRCPECGAKRDALDYYCDHLDVRDAFARDMTPRLVIRG